MESVHELLQQKMDQVSQLQREITQLEAELAGGAE